MSDNDDTPRGLMDEDGRFAQPLRPDPDEPSEEVTIEKVEKIGPAMLVLTLCVVAAYIFPGLEFAQPLKAGDPVPFWNLLGRGDTEEKQAIVASERHAKAVDELMRDALVEVEEEPEEDPLVIHDDDPQHELPPYEPHPDDSVAVEQALELFSGNELDAFFTALGRTQARYDGATTRVMHWGDSVIGLDGVTSAIRRRLQKRFGDGGHGYHLMSPPNTSYRHKGVKFRHNDRWSTCFIIRNCAKDGHYGIGGATFEARAGAQSWFRPDPRRSSGLVSRFKLFYAAQPDGARLQLSAGDMQPIVLDTDAPSLEDRFHVIELDDGAHELSVKVLPPRDKNKRAKARVYGVAMERDVPGVVWDGLALLGAFSKRLLLLDDDHLARQLEFRPPHMVVFMFGGNDMIRKISMERYIEEYGSVIAQAKRARPEMSCAIMSPLDHGLRRGRRVISRPIVAKMVDAQREVARQQGCAFFDTFAAMGGTGSAGRWYKKKPRLIGGDLSHLTNKGQIVVGEMFYRALMQAYVAYRTGQALGPGAAAEPKGDGQGAFAGQPDRVAPGM